MSNITDSTNLSTNIAKTIGNQYNLITESINLSANLYNELFSKISLTIADIVQSNMLSGFQVIIDQINSNQQIYKSIIESNILHIDNLIPTFNSLIDTVNNSLYSIELPQCSNKEIEDLQVANAQLNEIKQTIHTPNKAITFERVCILVQTLIAIFVLCQTYHSNNVKSQNDEINRIETENFQNSVIELLQEIADTSNLSPEIYLETIENTQIQADGNP